MGSPTGRRSRRTTCFTCRTVFRMQQARRNWRCTRVRAHSLFLLKNSVICFYLFLRNQAVTILKIELTSLCATFSPFRFFFLSLLTVSYMVCVQLVRRRGLTFGFSPCCKDLHTNKGIVTAALVWSKYSKKHKINNNNNKCRDCAVGFCKIAVM